MNNLLSSIYLIDGAEKELTPAALLGGDETPGEGRITDESIDPAPGLLDVDADRLYEYLNLVMGAKMSFPVPFAADYSRALVAEALIDSLWRQGNFRLDDLSLTLKWVWNLDTLGAGAAFYSSVEAVADYIDAMRLNIRRYSVEQGPLSFKVTTPFSGAPLLLPSVLDPDSQSWIIYIPFDSSPHRLGGSLLSQVLGPGGGVSPAVSDADYFMDCFELVRELVEDEVAVSGVTVREGGLLKALKRMSGAGTGADIDLSPLLKGSDRRELVRVGFSEVPGVLLQIRDFDFDYIDAECLLQDIACFPLGHPICGSDDLLVRGSSQSGIQRILDSLVQNAEGED
ncbi:MAG: hypothetical protein IJU69_07650 [Bacteroidales bacterium]|nr:hypothetical protein [Bacteroidales bacterium]